MRWFRELIFYLRHDPGSRWPCWLVGHGWERSKVWISHNQWGWGSNSTGDLECCKCGAKSYDPESSHRAELPGPPPFRSRRPRRMRRRSRRA